MGRRKSDIFCVSPPRGYGCWLGRGSNKQGVQSDARSLGKLLGPIETNCWSDRTSDARRIVHPQYNSFGECRRPGNCSSKKVIRNTLPSQGAEDGKGENVPLHWMQCTGGSRHRNVVKRKKPLGLVQRHGADDSGTVPKNRIRGRFRLTCVRLAIPCSTNSFRFALWNASRAGAVP